jgi:hypothetical protein
MVRAWTLAATALVSLLCCRHELPSGGDAGHPDAPRDRALDAPPPQEGAPARDATKDAGKDLAGRDQAGKDRAGKDQAGKDQAGKDQAGKLDGNPCAGAASGAACPNGKCNGGTCCTGCVNKSGACVTGNTPYECGTAGGACTSCLTSDECKTPSCNKGTCTLGNQMDGIACKDIYLGQCRNGSCCTGCWNGACQAGDQPKNCGIVGNWCSDCTVSADECSTGDCVSHTCLVKPATGILCASGQGICQMGICCTGCWNGSTCQTGTTSQFCGKGGELCQSCGSNACSGGACQP